jgi:hypothetical protein
MGKERIYPLVYSTPREVGNDQGNTSGNNLGPDYTINPKIHLYKNNSKDWD